MFVWTPGGKITGPALGNERMDMRIPFEVSTKRVKDTNKPGSKVFSFIKFRKHTEDDISDGMKKTIQREWSLRKYMRSSSGIVKTQCLWLQEMSLQDIRKARF